MRNLSQNPLAQDVKRLASDSDVFQEGLRPETYFLCSVLTDSFLRANLEGRRIGGCVHEVDAGQREGDEKINDEESDDTVNGAYGGVV